MKLVSIIIPVYNVEKYIDRCLNSVITQTYKNIEVILVDDGSTDKSGKICDKWSLKDSRIKSYHKENGGLADARNYGVAKANGDYIEFLDSDDFIEETTVETCMKYVNLYDNVDILCFGMKIEFENGNSYVKKMKETRNVNNIRGLIALNSYENIEESACNKMFAKRMFDNISFPVGKYCEDYYIMYKLFYKARNIVIMNNNFYHYWQRDNSITHKKTFNIDYVLASISQLKFIREKCPKLENIGISNYIFSLIALYNFYLINPKAKEIEGYTKKDIAEIIKHNKKSVYKNKYMPFKKKAQLFILTNCKTVYSLLFGIKSREV